MSVTWLTPANASALSSSSWSRRWVDGNWRQTFIIRFSHCPAVTPSGVAVLDIRGGYKLTVQLTRLCDTRPHPAVFANAQTCQGVLIMQGEVNLFH